MSLDVVDHRAGRGFRLRDTRDMRSKEDIWMRPKRMIGVKRLWIGDIDDRT